MRRMMLNGSLVLTALVTVPLCAASPGRRRPSTQEDQRLGMESHIGKLTGHAAAAARQLPQVLRRLPWRVGRRRGRERAMARSQAAQLYLGNLQVPLDHNWDPARSTRIFSTPSDEVWTARTCRPGTRFPRKSGRIWWRMSSTSRRAWSRKNRERRLKFRQKPEVTAERLKAGQEVFQRVECWKCHGPTGRGNGPSASHAHRRPEPADSAL